MVSALGPEDTDRSRGRGQPDLEQQLGLYDALVETRLRVLLLEVGRGVEYSLLPQSIGYLKQKQGALRWRPSHGDPTAPPNCQFWKYLRYGMPHTPELNWIPGPRARAAHEGATSQRSRASTLLQNHSQL